MAGIGEVNIMRFSRIIQAALVIIALGPIAQAAAFGMGGGVAPGAGGTGMAMGNPAMAGANLSYGHGSPAATNPAVAAIEARQREAQISAEIEQARKAGKSVATAESERRKGDGALESNHPDQAMADFERAERDLGVVPKNTAMGSYSRSELGSVTPGGTELSGAIVH